jgi:microcystin-dependent protein
MATVTGFTAERMLAIENATVVDGEVIGDNLFLIRHDGGQIDAGNVRGATGPTGPIGVPVAPGIIAMFGGNVSPPGWALCDWAELSRTTEAALFNAIGTSWGPGDGVNTFNAPMIQERIPVGKGTAAWANALAKVGGSKDLIIVAHSHDMGHVHSVAAHNHDMSHGHTASSGWQSADHIQSGTVAANTVPGYAKSYYGGERIVTNSNSYFDRAWQVFSNAGGGQDTGIQLRMLGELPLTDTNHAHWNAGGVSANHYHDVSVGGFSGGTGTAGGQTLTHTGSTGSAIGGAVGTDKNLPPYVVVNFIVKL